MSGLKTPDGPRLSEAHPERQADVPPTWSGSTLCVVLTAVALRSGAVENVSRFLDRAPAIRRVLTRWRGPLHAVDTRLLSELKTCCENHGAEFSLDLVLEAESDPSVGYERRLAFLTHAQEVNAAVRAEKIATRWLIPLAPELIHRLETVFSFALDEGADPVLVPTDLLDSHPAGGGQLLDASQRLFAWDFVTYRLLDEDGRRISVERAAFYRTLQNGLADGARVRHDEEEAVILRNDRGTEWTCSVENWPELGRAGAGSDRNADLAAPAAELFSFFLDGLRAVGQWALATAIPRSRARATEKLKSVLIIGAYGGEHIGDAAILGGVLFRLHQRYGTERAILMSQRPEHTRHLIPMLDVPVELEVKTYEHAEVSSSLAQVDAVVFGGGPLIDLPKQLVRHLYAAALARRKGKPFIMEGIGPGPFPRWPSKWLGRRLAKMADRISVRTGDDTLHPVVRDLSPVAGRDPAFDYLATRGETLTRLPIPEREAIAALLSGTERRPVIGINVRPIRHLFTAGTVGQDRAEYTRRAEARFEQEFADGLTRFDRSSPVKPCFVFYPMNAIQFGSSDLRSAYRIGRLLDDGVDFRVWEADASLDGVVALLRRLDVVIAMRFHAAIFALSQQRPVIGIDYRIGKRDKVAALLDDFGQGMNCRRIDEITGEWLFERLSKVVGESVVFKS